jgi:tRNA dimethylallyltransferase
MASAFDCLVITGPTASGKTGVAIDVARQIDGEIISVDSRQVYQDMDIGTAKATPAERAAVPHHGLDLLPPTERYNAGRFAAAARTWIADITARGRVPILVGGTGFFLRALTHPMFNEPPLDAARKERLKGVLNQKSREELLAWLGHLDPVGAARVTDEAGRQRIARMIEVVLLTGHPLHWWQRQPANDAAPINALTVVLTLDRAALYERINQRVVEMVSSGLVQEVETLLARGYDEHTPGMKTVGYIELIPYLRGQTTLAEAVDAIQRATRGYARRQITWFRHQLAEPVVEIDASLPRAEIVDLIVREWRQKHENRN